MTTRIPRSDSAHDETVHGTGGTVSGAETRDAERTAGNGRAHAHDVSDAARSGRAFAHHGGDTADGTHPAPGSREPSYRATGGVDPGWGLRTAPRAVVRSHTRFPAVPAAGADPLVRIHDPAGRPRGLGFLADHHGTLLTSHEAVAGLDRLVLRAGDRTQVVGADA
ncbi:hypothetical protein ACFY7X_35085, partial [Streptomyces althioticus]